MMCIQNWLDHTNKPPPQFTGSFNKVVLFCFLCLNRHFEIRYIDFLNFKANCRKQSALFYLIPDLSDIFCSSLNFIQ